MIPILTAAATLVPSLARWIGGDKAGDVADKVAGVVTTLTGNPDPLVGLEAIKADPALLAQFQQAVMAQEVELYRIDAADRDSARQRAVTMNDHKPVYIGVLVILIWAAINFVLLLSKDPPQIPPETLGRLLGMVDAVTMAFVYWLWGSSAGSSRKTRDLADIAKGP